MEKYDQALADFSRAIELDPDLALAYSNRGNTYADLQLYDQALADLTHAIKLDPSLTLAYFNLGALFANTGQLRKSLPYLEKAAQLGYPQATQAIAKIKQMLGQK